MSTSVPKTAFRSSEGVYTSPYGPFKDIEPSTMYEHLWGKRNTTFGKEGSEERIALIDYTTQIKYTRKEARNLVIRLAATLIKTYNIKPGDHILISYPTSSIFAILTSACFRAGIIMAMANPAYTPEELRHACQVADAKLILTATPLKQSFMKAGVNESIIVDALPSAQNGQGLSTLWNNILESEEESEKILQDAGSNNLNWNDACGIFFSSGTTGLPKAVLISNRNLVSLRTALTSISGWNADPQWNKGWPANMVIFLPAFHIAGLATLVLGLSEGGTICFALSNPMDLQMVMKAIKEYRPRLQTFVPPLLLAITRFGLAGPNGFKGTYEFVYSAAAPLGKGLQEEAQEKLKVRIGQLWGMSETTGAVTASDPLKNAPGGSCGQIVPGMEMKFIDEDDKIVPHGQPGEVLVRGHLNMICYYNNEKATKETLTDVSDFMQSCFFCTILTPSFSSLLQDGWLRTGDIGFMDDEGILYIVDRRKELIKYKAMQIAPAELEGILLTHPSVMDVGVVGVVGEDASIGEVPRAFIVLRPDQKDAKDAPSFDQKSGKACQPNQGKKAKEIEEFIASKVTNYKRLRGGVVFLDEIPKNPSGKILRRFLRDMSKADEKSKL
ncbi:hypothetical protein L7F22_003092 [Adiantum nelumboides]|nr:hypothetical protein [Adiantum nelumboides]